MVGPPVGGYWDGMSTQYTSADLPDDQDAEPTMNAPEEGRPDGLEALKSEQSGDSPEQPQHSDAAVLEAEEEEGPTDE